MVFHSPYNLRRGDSSVEQSPEQQEHVDNNDETTQTDVAATPSEPQFDANADQDAVALAGATAVAEDQQQTDDFGAVRRHGTASADNASNAGGSVNDRLSTASAGGAKRKKSNKKSSKASKQEEIYRATIRRLTPILDDLMFKAEAYLTQGDSVNLHALENIVKTLGKNVKDMNVTCRLIQQEMLKRGVSGQPVIHYSTLQENLTPMFTMVETLTNRVHDRKRGARQDRSVPQAESLLQAEPLSNIPLRNHRGQDAFGQSSGPDSRSTFQRNYDDVIQRRGGNPRQRHQPSLNFTSNSSGCSGQTRPFGGLQRGQRQHRDRDAYGYGHSDSQNSYDCNDYQGLPNIQAPPRQHRAAPQPVLAPQCYAHQDNPYGPMNYDREEPDYFYEGLRQPWNVIPTIPAAADDDLLKNVQKGRMIIFSGKSGTYYSWRQKFIQCIHLRRTGASAKAFALQASLDQSDPHLRLLASSITLDQDGYRQAIVTLEDNYGGDQKYCTERLQALRAVPFVRQEDVHSLFELDIKLRGYVGALQAAGYHERLNYEDEVFRHVLTKLDSHLSIRCSDWLHQHGYTPCLNNLSVFIGNELSRLRRHDNLRGASMPTKRAQSRTFISRENDLDQDMKESIILAGFQAVEIAPPPDCDACDDKHYLKKCPKFLSMSPQQRFDLIMTKKRCFRCLKLGHLVTKCTSSTTCKSCDKAHHTLLHGASTRRLKSFLTKEEDPTSDDDSDAEEQQITVHESTFKGNSSASISLPIAPVKLFACTNTQRNIEVNALIDSGNTTTILSELAAKALGVTGYQDPVVIEGVGGRPITSNFYARFLVKNIAGDEHAEITARIVPQPTGGLRAADWNEYKHRFPHLRNVDFVTPCQRRNVDVILGTNAGKLTRTLQADICGPHQDDPIAKRTPLGWVASGKLDPTVKSEDVKTYMSYFLGRTLDDLPRCSADISQSLSSSCSVANYELFGSSEESLSPGSPGLLADLAAKRVAPTKKHFWSDSPGFSADLAANTKVLVDEGSLNGNPGKGADSVATQLEPTDDSSAASLHCAFADQTEDSKLSQLVEAQWAIEETPADDEKALSIDEQRARQLLKEKGSFENGQATMPVLWRRGEPTLENNFDIAKAMYLRTLKQPVMRNEQSRNAYNAPLINYRSKGYFIEAPMGSGKYYLTHFGVYRKDKVTSQIRPVMNGAKKFNGKSLNDAILAGPKLINELPEVLLQFRKNAICLSCDIREMFLNIHLLPEDQKYHHFLWSESGNPEDIKDYKWTRHIFGNAGSPCCCIHAIKEYAQQRGGEYPAAAYVVSDCTLVDDNLTSANSVEEVFQMIRELKLLYGEIGLTIGKFMSNSQEVMSTLSEDEKAPNLDLAALQASASGTPTLKALGVHYSAKEDVFTFKKELPSKDNIVWTKRKILAFYASLFDPHGLISPIVISARIAFQRLWTRDYDWDDPVQSKDLVCWLDWLESLPDLPKLSIPRCLFNPSIDSPIRSRSLHVFCDASGDAVGSSIYQLTRFENGEMSSRLVMSKAKLAPIKTVTIPRLELVAAHLGTQLATVTQRTLEIDDVHFYTDSKNVICWLHASSRQLLTFVANRVAKILRATSLSTWHWVPTDRNPADLASRGSTTEQLLNNDLWWQGPIEIMKDPPEFVIETTEDSEKELKRGEVFNFTATSHTDHEPLSTTLNLDRFSDWRRVLRILALCRRFVMRLKTRHSAKSPLKKVTVIEKMIESREVYKEMFPVFSGKHPIAKGRKTHMIRREYSVALSKIFEPLTPEEIQWAERHTLIACQSEAFPDEMRRLRHSLSVAPQSQLIKLRPSIGDDGLMRMTGRLRAAQHLGFNAKCPIILPRNHHITNMIIRDCHNNVLKHIGGTGHTLATLNEKFWPIGGRQAVKSCQSECIKCRRTLAAPKPQEEAPLQDCRFLPTAAREVPFHTTGVDAAGPFEVKLGRGTRKSSGMHKRWFIIFACTVYRCIHVEMVSSLSADCFLEAFSRFLARKPRPKTIISDNGGNFKASSLILKELFTNLESEHPDLSRIYPEIHWKLNTPLSPHQGGHYERLVGSMKRALALVLPSHTDLSEEQLNTCLIVCEGILNSRPLSYVSTDENDLSPLTPAHFLLQKGYTDLAPISGQATQTKAYGKKWMNLQLLLDRIWARFVKEIVPQLNVMNKWTTKRDNLKPGDIVAVLEEKARGVWPIGRIVKVFPNSKDGKVRRATVLVKGKEYERSLSRIVVIQEATSP